MREVEGIFGDNWGRLGGVKPAWILGNMGIGHGGECGKGGVGQCFFVGEVQQCAVVEIGWRVACEFPPESEN